MFWRVFSALVTADAIDRWARGRPQRYWYPQPPPSRAPYPDPSAVAEPARRAPQAPRAWDPERPERV